MALDSWRAKSDRELWSSTRWFLPEEMGIFLVLHRDRHTKGPMCVSVALKAIWPFDLGRSGYDSQTQVRGVSREKVEAYSEWLWSMLSIALRFVNTRRTRDLRRRLRGVVMGRLEM